MQIFKRAGKLTLLAVCFIVPTFVFSQDTDSLSQAQSQIQADSLAAIVKDKGKGLKATISVIDGNTGKPLSGVSVTIPGFSGAITDEKGLAKISIPDKNALVEISYNEYLTREEYLKGRNAITVRLQAGIPGSQFGRIGSAFGSGFKSANPFSTSSVRSNDFWSEGSKETPDSYLQGKISGLNVVRRSGTPSIGANMFLRGFNSLNTDNQPLVVLDGVIFNNSNIPSLFSGASNNALENIDIKDIENIVLIKDAGAAVYGTKAANGVLLITTKRAISEATKIDFGAFAGFNSSVGTLPVMGSSDYRLYLSSLLQSGNFSGAQIQSLPYFSGSEGNSDYYKYQFNTNWQKEVLASAFNQNYHLNVSGGDNIARYNLSLGYLNNRGVIKNSGLSRYFTRFNSDFAFSKKFKASTNLSFSSTEHTLFNQGSAYNTSPIYLGLTKSPFMSPNDVGALGELSPNYAQADIFGASNPAAIVGSMDAVNNSYRVNASATFAYNFSNRWALQSQLGIMYDKGRDNLFIPSRGLAKDTLLTAVANNKLGSNTNRLFALFNDSRLSFLQIYNNVHAVSARLGVRFKQDRYETDRGVTYNSSTDEYRSLSGGNGNLREIGGSLRNMRWLNTYANVDYSLSNKYFLSLNTAVDGSSRFGKTIPGVLTINGNKMAVMPSVGAAWLVSSEEFLANNRIVDLFKLRASYGLVGNDDIGDFQARPYYVSQGFFDLKGFTRGNVGNTDLKWETVEKLNAGFDMALLAERLNVSLDVYRNYTKDMITYDPLNPVTGFERTVSNGGEMRTTGFDISLGARMLNRKVKWDANLLFSRYKNEITKLNSGTTLTEFAGATILTQIGMPANVFYGYKTTGVYATSEELLAANAYVNPSGSILIPATAGDVRFVNMDGLDGAGRVVINQNDRTVIGDPNPDFTGAFGNTLTYGNWSFNALFTFSYGNEVYNGLRHNLESMSGYQNQLLSVNSRWRAEGQITNTPKAVWGDPSGNSRFSDRWIEDGSYFRLRTLAVSYTIPIKNNSYLKTLKVYGNASNVFTVTKYLGFDPEFSGTRSALGQGVDAGLEPQFRTVQIGVRVGL